MRIAIVTAALSLALPAAGFAEHLLGALTAGDSTEARGIEKRSGARLERGPAASPVKGWLDEAATTFRPGEGETEIAARQRVTGELRGRVEGLGRPLTTSEERYLRNLRTTQQLYDTALSDKYDNSADNRWNTLQFLSPRGKPNVELDPWSRASAEALYWDRYANPWYYGIAGSERGSGNPRMSPRGEDPRVAGYYRDLALRMREREIPTFSSMSRKDLDFRMDDRNGMAPIEHSRRWVHDTYDSIHYTQYEWDQKPFWRSDIADWFSTWRRARSLNNPNSPKQQARVASENNFLDTLYGRGN